MTEEKRDRMTIQRWTRLRSHGAELVGEIVQYEGITGLCFPAWP
jgi:hypothetical protein